MRHPADTPQHTSPRARRGFSLLELLLVSAVLIALLALAWPSMQRVYADLELKQGSEKVRGEFVQARLFAIDAGRTYQFRYEPLGRRYVALPLEADGAPGGTSPPSGAGFASQPAVLSASERLSGSLSEGLRFEPSAPGPEEAVTTVTDPAYATQQLSADRFAGLEEASMLAGVKWSAPVLFHADGTSSGGGVAIVDEEGRSIPLSIRDLTGAVSLGPIARRSRW